MTDRDAGTYLSSLNMSNLNIDRPYGAKQGGDVYEIEFQPRSVIPVMSRQIKREDFRPHGAVRDANFYPDNAPEPGIVSSVQSRRWPACTARVIPPRRMTVAQLRKQEKQKRRERKFPHVCLSCGCRFHREVQLQAHYHKRRSHWLREEPLQPILCPTCQLPFRSKKAGSSLKKHFTGFPHHRR